jgi:hypothetical protein
MVSWSDLLTGLFGGAAGSLIVVYGLSRWLGEAQKSYRMELSFPREH